MTLRLLAFSVLCLYGLLSGAEDVVIQTPHSDASRVSLSPRSTPDVPATAEVEETDFEKATADEAVSVSSKSEPETPQMSALAMCDCYTCRRDIPRVWVRRWLHAGVVETESETREDCGPSCRRQYGSDAQAGEEVEARARCSR
uniref:Spondin domain-containing protein n=1 Tax=Chromera velia CCMP2878 TaxID=1169474 RepID=A0A0G4HFG1_9ALVE|eukprot:Cvel_27029.t1-p1 / transcript=Cvel_27029.t1 / gene=Cvel_27029 / organism=Chromera_velia_CCMP2878 / gene_product=hypothetical protein / transcript_product=hypothetical protein / location=Cvel_scaffold3307:2579-3007(+) / protein_length=143 / sequence_SO=supercontig / SO=protein_coding / is_pseudo=false